MSQAPEIHLRNEDYTDRELLHIVHDCSDKYGWATTSEIADMLGLAEGGGHAVASRMAWMVRYKFCQRHPERPGVYRLTKAGHALKDGSISRNLETSLKDMSDGDRVLVLRTIAQATMVGGRTPAATMMRREFAHRAAKRKRR